MKLHDVSVDKRCPDGCGCLDIDGIPSPPPFWLHGGPFPGSVMWTHQNVDVALHGEYRPVVMRGGVLHDVDLDKYEDDYVDLLLPCGTVVGYVEVVELPGKSQ